MTILNIDDALHGVSTVVTVSSGSLDSQGTGFFYQQLAPKDPQNDNPWREVLNVWLVTNRHVLLPRVAGSEQVPQKLAFYIRKLENNQLRWESIIIEKDDLLKRAKFHTSKETDIAIIQIHDLLKAKLMGGGNYLQWYGVSAENLSGNNNIFMEAGDDIIVIGYPRGFYDEYNLYPIVKAGIVASRWGAQFNGNPYFLIDAKLFPGSSGSIVISKPKDVAVVNGQMYFAKEKQFAFLGVYSGELYRQDTPIELDDMTIIQKSGFNLGIVWYGNLVEDIIKNGISFTSS